MSQMAMDQVVTFGKKYKGKPLHLMLADKGYMDWIKNTPGLLEKFNLNNLNIVNVTNNIQNVVQFDQPTPEHNKLQNKFLSSEYIDKYLNFAWNVEGKVADFNAKLQNDIRRITTKMSSSEWLFEPCRLTKHTSLRGKVSEKPQSPNVEFELKTGWDVLLAFEEDGKLGIESEEISEAFEFEPGDKLIQTILQKLYKRMLQQSRDKWWDKKWNPKWFLQNIQPNDFREYVQKLNPMDMDIGDVLDWSNPDIKSWIEYEIKELLKQIFENNEVLKASQYDVEWHSKSRMKFAIKYQAKKITRVANHYIEIKTTLGDEYPRVLREMKSRKGTHNGRFVLLLNELAAESVTRQELREIFSQEEMTVYFFDEIGDVEDECEEDVLEHQISALERDLENLKKRRKIVK